MASSCIVPHTYIALPNITKAIVFSLLLLLKTIPNCKGKLLKQRIYTKNKAKKKNHGDDFTRSNREKSNIERENI